MTTIGVDRDVRVLRQTVSVKLNLELACNEDVLAVALNSDASVGRMKGPSRPIIGENERAAMVLALAAVDAVEAECRRLVEGIRDQGHHPFVLQVARAGDDSLVAEPTDDDDGIKVELLVPGAQNREMDPVLVTLAPGEEMEEQDLISAGLRIRLRYLNNFLAVVTFESAETPPATPASPTGTEMPRPVLRTSTGWPRRWPPSSRLRLTSGGMRSATSS